MKEHLSTAVNGPRGIYNGHTITRCVDCGRFQVSQCQIGIDWRHKFGPMPMACPLPREAEK